MVWQGLQTTEEVDNGLAKKLRNSYTNNDIKEAYWVQRNEGVKSKEICSDKETTLHLVAFSNCNPREYWQVINKAAGERRKCIPVELDAMADYFMKLNECDEIRKLHDPPCIEDDILDVTIDEEEVCGAINTLKYNKAPGLDRLPPELFKMFNQELVGFFQVYKTLCIRSVGLWDVLYLSIRKVMSLTQQLL